VKPTTLIIACGAIAHELVELQRRNGWEHARVKCLPADLHNTPKNIAGAVESAIREHRPQFDHIYVAYGDCGTGGKLDAVLSKWGVERLPGAHCYDFFARPDHLAALAEQEPGTFYLTDFLTRHFERLVIRGLGLDRHPELRDEYFGNYRRLVLLSQAPSAELTGQARAHAETLGLDFEEHVTGLRHFERALRMGIAHA